MDLILCASVWAVEAEAEASGVAKAQRSSVMFVFRCVRVCMGRVPSTCVVPMSNTRWGSGDISQLVSLYTIYDDSEMGYVRVDLCGKKQKKIRHIMKKMNHAY